MAEPLGQDEVNGTQSAGAMPPVDASARSHTSTGAGGDEVKPQEQKERILEKPAIPHASDLTTMEQPAAGDKLVNGGSTANSEDAGFHAATDAAVGSDTDSRADSADHNKPDFSRHERSNSIAKKPTAFKPVSVTKNFLAKSGAVAAAPAKPALEKGSSGTSTPTPASATLRPRLVAKSGRESRVTTTGPGLRTAGGPDASKVWNRNRPAPPPPPKQFTDEELKQQYGIHMATRLQADESGKESKWADIDDDEDDWAPEAVQWMDGTKSTPQPDDNHGAAQESAHNDEEAKKEGEEAAKDVGQNVQPTTSLGPGKTILRPGTRLLGTPTKPGLVLKNVPEPQAETGYPQSRTQSRSPWAQLPPVDKVSPIVFRPPAAQANTSGSGQVPLPSGELDNREMENTPTKEIAADDFDRSWREGEKRDTQLFNSQSGRYEPVRNNRRASFRADGSFRPASLLQRPSASGTPGSQDARAWTQRRSSSFNAEQDAKVETDGSASSMPTHETTQASPDSNQSVNNAAETSGQPNAFYATNFHGITAAEGDREDQKKKMREMIEANRKRKQEEERLEAEARAERIRLKMAALGPLPPKEPAQKQSTEKQAAELQSNTRDQSVNESDKGNDKVQPSPTPDNSDEPKDATKQKDKNSLDAPSRHANTNQTLKYSKTGEILPSSSSSYQSAASLAHPEAQAAHRQDSLPKAPVEAISNSPPDDNSVLSKPVFSAEQAPPAHAQLTPPKSPGQPVSETSLAPQPAPAHPETHRPPHTQPPLDRSTAGWNNVAPSQLSVSWAPHSATSANVWGPPSNDRPLGNGAFDSGLPSLPLNASQNHQQRNGLASGPGPIAPPSQTPRVASESGRFQPSPVHDYLRTASAPAMPQPRTLNNLPSNGRRDPFGRQQDGNLAMSGWHSLPDQLAKEEAEQAVQSRRLVEDFRAGIHNFQPVYKQTYRQTAENNAGERTITRVLKSVHDYSASTADELSVASSQVPAQSATASTSIPVAPLLQANTRPSRFFGPAADKSQNYVQAGQSLSQSPEAPPPEIEQHPVFSGSNSPMVKLPTTVKVKLPPAPKPDQSNRDSVIMPSRLAPRQLGVQPIAQTSAWQSRFDGLFNTQRKPQTQAQAQAQPAASSPLQTHSAAPVIVSLTKAPLEASMHGHATTVSLPPPSPIYPLNFTLPNDRIESKPTEEALMDEREFGSSPIVKLAREAEYPTRIRKHPAKRPILIYVAAETFSEFRTTAQSIGSSGDEQDRDGSQIIRIYLRAGMSQTFKKLFKKPSSRTVSQSTKTTPQVQSKAPRRRSTWAKPPRGNRGKYGEA